jgi:hypothetical protein
LVLVTKYDHPVVTDGHRSRAVRSYFAGGVGGAPLNVLRAYIEQQPYDHNPPRPEDRSPFREDR